MRVRFLLALAMMCAGARGAPESVWTVARSSHFEVYSQSGEADARAALNWFEHLRAFFVAQTSVEPESRPPVRVIGFRSVEQYNSYRSRPTAAAYYVGTETRDYIVMPSLSLDQYRAAAHEYTHVLLHASGRRLPPWLAEGIAECFSTIRITVQGSSIGGDLPGRSPALRGKWMPLQELVSSSSPGGLFYAQSWAVVQMLALSPEYRSGFASLVGAIEAGATSLQALTTVYGKSVDAITNDAHTWFENRRTLVVKIPSAPSPSATSAVIGVSTFDSGMMLADLLCAAAEYDRAAAAYRALAKQAPNSAAVYAGLGWVALRRGDPDDALRQWKHAIELAVDDPTVCYRYATLAVDKGLDARPALERALALQPVYDDARFNLALIEVNSGHYDAAVVQFRAMKLVSPGRAYAYWSGLAYSLNELGQRVEAKSAAGKAAQYADTDSQREHANQLAYFADTDMEVRFMTDANGRTQLITTRAPHGQADWNPFIEPGDRMRRVDGTLREIRCGDKATRFVVNTADGTLVLAIADPSRVQMRNAPSEFTCGPQEARAVRVEYAVLEDREGLARGIEFR